MHSCFLFEEFHLTIDLIRKHLDHLCGLLGAARQLRERSHYIMDSYNQKFFIIFLLLPFLETFSFWFFNVNH